MKFVLKNCPFCGKPPVMLATHEGDKFIRCYEVRCDDCGIGVSEEYEAPTVDLWNKRAAPTKIDPLFKHGDFISAAGLKLTWKIECDALTDADWQAIAAAAADSLPHFCEAIGVPRGGLRLAEALNAYATDSSKLILVVDDVWTTGKSLTEFAREHATGEWRGFVAFARGDLPRHVSCFAQIGLDVSEAKHTVGPHLLTPSEIQSGLDRQRRAEILIEQLPPDHDGRNSWLMNYGIGDKAKALRLERNLPWSDAFKSVYPRHVHAAGALVGLHVDTCAHCGADFRNEIHSSTNYVLPEAALAKAEPRP
jgi:Lar family restriction alleviation protein